ncbi:MAG: Glyoxylate/hydroxypyruvate reductase B [Candidatus Moanabacter tarae]|uniref:Glyoxylate/hydroxypyruvate reductase B n=1 Tax=Candidatus Moanibacter tarae TaxID=2200854 RepID=A0A2Z4AFE4_9BACT|nr:MAG: Glyoxylate/hydroxypyruvate reductase B [Candidatus Moanabacter tarae]|tara:strand:+ start:5947 stop:6915 length:969 start_codon:yes stop_codon:yes gene_type:complete
MSYKFVFLSPSTISTQKYSEGMIQAVPNIEIHFCNTREQSLKQIRDASACFGTLDLQLLAEARDLKWLAAPAAGPPKGFYFEDLIQSDVVVTNFRGIYNDHISIHIMAFILVFARQMHLYFSDQFIGHWRKGGETSDSIYLPNSTALIIGAGGIGGETARQCKHFGMSVIAVDPRIHEAPDGVDRLYRPDKLDSLLPEADFVILTAPQTPATEGLFTSAKFEKMNNSAYFINIGRGSNVILADLNTALRKNEIAGAALDVFEEEPLPIDHPLWKAPNFLMTPHVAASGPFLEDRRFGLMIENTKRFSEGKELLNIVDKANWF